MPTEEPVDKEYSEPLFHLAINSRADIQVAKSKARNIAERLGFKDHKGNIVLALAELCTNLLNHSDGGEITIRPLPRELPQSSGRSDQPGIEVCVSDSGPGIYDVERAFKDGFSRSDSRGEGLGKVNQAVDELDVSTGPEGTEFSFRVWERTLSEAGETNHSPLDIGFATRRHPSMEQNGDAFLHKSWDKKTLVGVIDGVGHGKHAKVAALKATEYIESHYDLDLETILRGTNRACRGTRGVVGGLVKFFWSKKSVRLEYTGVGNIECLIVSDEDRHNLISKRGLLGKSLPPPQVISRDWKANNRKLMVLQSDGVTSHWSSEDFANILEKSGSEIANKLIKNLAMPDDDATVAAIKFTPG